MESLSSSDESSDERNSKADGEGQVDQEEETEAGAANKSTTKPDKKKRRKFYFSQKSDLALLKEILSIEPFAGGHGQSRSPANPPESRVSPPFSHAS